jgi:hypothetical protein
MRLLPDGWSLPRLCGILITLRDFASAVVAGPLERKLGTCLNATLRRWSSMPLLLGMAVRQVLLPLRDSTPCTLVGQCG